MNINRYIVHRQVSWVSLPFNPHTRVTDELFGHDYSRHVHPRVIGKIWDVVGAMVGSP